MIHPPYISILKAKKGELAALSEFYVRRQATGLLPLIEILPQELDSESRKKLTNCDYLDKKVMKIRKALLVNEEPIVNGLSLTSPQVELFIDNYFWDSNILLENQVHPLEYLCKSIAHERVSVNPVVGYDRWFDDDGASLYIGALKNLSEDKSRKFCLRIDGDTIDYEVQYDAEGFLRKATEILNTLQISPELWTVLLDFKDVRASSPEELVNLSNLAINILAPIGFDSIYIGGGSAPIFVSDVVEKDSSGTTPRIEIEAWKTLLNQNINIGFADYGVRNPESPDNVQNKYVNSKVLYTTDRVFYVIRGSSLEGLTGCDRSEKFIPLVNTLIDSKYYTDCNNCWGDDEIYQMLYKPTADLTQWVSYSTNRHLCYVTDEVYEHQRLVAAKQGLPPAREEEEG